jgi:hypothetical protein
MAALLRGGHLFNSKALSTEPVQFNQHKPPDKRNNFIRFIQIFREYLEHHWLAKRCVSKNFVINVNRCRVVLAPSLIECVRFG